jgi:asparagine synthase (glutamine-hydrolysing)
VRYYNPVWLDPTHLPTAKADLALLRTTFENAVRKRMMTDVPYGVLLSGGLDSSLVASVAARFAPTRVEEEGKSKAWWSTLHTFAIGLKGASDLPFAKKVADFLGTVHHEFNFTVQQGLDALRDVVYHLETFDVTTIRASTPMFLLSRKIRAMGVKMVLSGEGSDELLAGYLYFHLAPNGAEMQREIVSRVTNLHLADNLRANKS